MLQSVDFDCNIFCGVDTNLIGVFIFFSFNNVFTPFETENISFFVFVFFDFFFISVLLVLFKRKRGTSFFDNVNTSFFSDFFIYFKIHFLIFNFYYILN